ncbi:MULTISPECIES: hormogonium polysaccharide secretion pseudopilin HpsC [unclassified Coleofasciculus]|uniref:hormogonium polysaccharide secretion pseudopilin HpsC n=1 Tax=unclassified Coleofasciculus TaxID=2692782 RepID=UPI0018811933|nr:MULTISPECIES: hormogonium polysaccharide secretion pseudopilin HpsC [unclassified Coleofasciculus]MBE9126701.1 prepilin-type N-terminal cleavage/methylation domain-containing protein [Coleofasciculus sp. LEGE 07081]MBE9150061.1 prepilin-type N-terminal cleavage/methylation domain-containing protein [Coleofasciculus sp. LEGE 07092]
MNSLLRLLLKRKLKPSRVNPKAGGFTLIELLVAIIMAALVIGPLLGFAINILSTDRQEQAKANSEQEIQTALDYIAADLEQAFYIYDGYGLRDQNIADQLPSVDGGVPVLVFWKREKVKDALHFNQSQLCNSGDASNDCNDVFPYSLVAYYLIQDDNPTWSQAARIARFQIRDGIKNPTVPTTGTFPNIKTNYLLDTDTVQGQADPGFQIFNLKAQVSDLDVSPIEARMNAWERSGAYNFTETPVMPLVDYIDQSTQDTPTPVDCRKTLLGSEKSPPEDPKRTKERMLTNSSPINSFYACVNSSTNEAFIYMRGNAQMRLSNPDNAQYNENSTFFPSATIRVKGRGFLGVE